MSEHTADRQWPDNITSGDIRYGKSSNYDGFYLADAMHGIPTFGSVSETRPVTIRGQNVQVFNYPGQTEAIAKALCDRWNAFDANQARISELEAAASDALSGWMYIRANHGDLYGVGWERVEDALTKALKTKAPSHG